MHYRVCYSLDFDPKIRSGQVCLYKKLFMTLMNHCALPVLLRMRGIVELHKDLRCRQHACSCLNKYIQKQSVSSDKQTNRLLHIKKLFTTLINHCALPVLLRMRGIVELHKDLRCRQHARSCLNKRNKLRLPP